jgi:hypothetical protein
VVLLQCYRLNLRLSFLFCLGWCLYKQHI